MCGPVLRLCVSLAASRAASGFGPFGLGPAAAAAADGGGGGGQAPPPASGQRAAGDRNALLADLEELRSYFQGIDIEGLVGGGLTEENLVRALRDGGSSLDEFRANSERFQIVRARLQDVGVQVVFEGEGRGGEMPLRDEEEEEDA